MFVQRLFFCIQNIIMAFHSFRCLDMKKRLSPFSESVMPAETQKRAMSYRHRPFSVLLFTCLLRLVFRCPQNIVFTGFFIFSYGSALKLGARFIWEYKKKQYPSRPRSSEGIYQISTTLREAWSTKRLSLQFSIRERSAQGAGFVCGKSVAE